MQSGKSKTIAEWRVELKHFYDQQGLVHSKALHRDVLFNNHGWKHLVRHSNGQRRNEADARLRLGLVAWLPLVITRCAKVRRTDTTVQVINGSNRKVVYYELCKDISFGKSPKRKTISVVVVLRKIEDGNLHYWTVRYGKNKKAP